MFKEKLYNILERINSLNKTKVEIMAVCINDRLDGSLNTYSQNVSKTCEYIISRNPITMLKNMSKEFKEEYNNTEDDDYEQ